MRPNPGLRHPALGGIASPAERHDSWRKRMQRASSENPGESAGALLALSNDLAGAVERAGQIVGQDRKSTRLNSSHRCISYAVFCLKKKKRSKQRDNHTCKHRADI